MALAHPNCLLKSLSPCNLKLITSMEIPCMPHEQHAQRFLHDTHALHGRNIFLLAGAVDFLWLQYKIDGFYTKIDRIKDVVPSCVFYPIIKFWIHARISLTEILMHSASSARWKDSSCRVYSNMDQSTFAWERIRKGSTNACDLECVHAVLFSFFMMESSMHLACVSLTYW